jgi:hypothetical protein
MARKRMLMIAARYEGCDDADVLRTDPALKIAVGRCPETGAAPSSPATADARIGVTESLRRPQKRSQHVRLTSGRLHGHQRDWNSRC